MESNAEGDRVGGFGDLEISYHGEKKVKLDVDTPRLGPVSAKPPPPEAPPSKYSSDRVVGKGSENGKAKIPEKRRTKDKKANQRPKKERHW